MFDQNDKNILGYFVVDMEKAGPYCMMSEALAMANGDPTSIGYLSGGNYARGFPQYVRRFNANFLALPALPSKVVEHAASDPDVVVRKIQTPSHGSYYFAVNTNKQSKQVILTLPDKGEIIACETGKQIHTDKGKITLEMYPFQLISWHVQ